MPDLLPAFAQASRSRVAQLLIPVVRAPVAREVEQVPNRLEGADMAGILSGVRRRVKELRAPEVADHTAAALEHIQHRSLRALRGLAEVVAVVGVADRGQQSQPPPAALLGKGEDAR